ncbi:MAG TPA: (Fe-S)-binding protein [Acetobacteraceae bacterium]|nr:(Fe-S)-binding protein [Acetobacteraceae bacterium]
MDGGFESVLQNRTREVLEDCTACGRCVEVCPMPGPAGLSAADAPGIAAGVLAILRGDVSPEASARWAAVCSGSGHCIPACPHGVNPRFMLTMARLAMQRRNDAAARRKDGFARFTGMTTGVRVLSRLQLPPELLARFRPDADDPGAASPDVVFYTGCNLLKTPHIALLCFDIMDAMGLRYRVMGGPSHCCGVLQFRAGDLTTSGRIAYRTVDRLGSAGGRVLTWCPTCQVQLSEVVIPGRSDDPLALTPFIRFLSDHLDDLRPLLRHPVHKRVGLHEHPGIAGVAAAAETILRMVPGLDFVDLAQPRVGYQCNTLNPLPAFKREVHRAQLQAAADAGVTTLAGIYHACHRELCSHERDWPFEVVNFLELVGESMGLTRPDLFKRLKLMQDVDAVLADAAPMIAAHHLDLDEARAVVLSDMLGEQPLPLMR